MKKIILSLVFVCVGLISLLGQDSLGKFQLGFDFSIGNNAIGRGNIYPSITLTKDKHLAFIGPAFIYGMYYNPYPPAYGLQAGYQIYPNGKKNRFNLFFEYDFNFVKAKFQMNYYSKSPTGLRTKNIEVTSIDNYLGFGFRLNITKGLYFKTNLGIGLVLYGENIKEEFNDGISFKSNYPLSAHVGKFYPFYSRDSYYNQYDLNNGQLIGIFKMGLGWNLYTFKKN